MVDRLGVHRMDEAEVVGDLCRVRQQLADPGAALAMTGEGELLGATGKLAWVASCR